MLIFKSYENYSRLDMARVLCRDDSTDAGTGSDFLTLPRPKNLMENSLYHDTFFNNVNTVAEDGDRYWLDISEKLPATDPRKWIYGDGTPIRSWRNWRDGEPNNHGDHGEPFVEVDPEGYWNDVKHTAEHKFMCVYYLPVGAENACPWLLEYQH